jgi:hypothetical protein
MTYIIRLPHESFTLLLSRQTHPTAGAMCYLNATR